MNELTQLELDRQAKEWDYDIPDFEPLDDELTEKEEQDDG